jgi:hypothetical protein
MKKNIEMESITDGIDALKEATDRKWGVGYLRLKVSPETRFKWDAQVERYEKAVLANHLPSVRVHAKSMTAGFDALEAEATKLGFSPTPPTIWTALAGPRQIAIHVVKEREHVDLAENEGVVTFTLDEIVQMIPPNIIAIKAQFKGTRLNNYEHEDFDDEIPF